MRMRCNVRNQISYSLRLSRPQGTEPHDAPLMRARRAMREAVASAEPWPDWCVHMGDQADADGVREAPPSSRGALRGGERSPAARAQAFQLKEARGSSCVAVYEDSLMLKMHGDIVKIGPSQRDADGRRYVDVEAAELSPLAAAWHTLPEEQEKELTSGRYKLGNKAIVKLLNDAEAVAQDHPDLPRAVSFDGDIDSSLTLLNHLAQFAEGDGRAVGREDFELRSDLAGDHDHGGHGHRGGT